MKKMNAFVKENVMGVGTAMTENGALSHATTGSMIIDQFGKAGSYRNRSYEEVWEDQAKLWAEDKDKALRFPFYLRMITRKTNMLNGEESEEVQRGQGAKDEAFKRLLWIAAYHPKDFYYNLWLLPIVGSWKDLWVIMCMAEEDTIPVSSFKLDHKQFFNTIIFGLNDKNHCDLVKKYFPRIRSNKKCRTVWSDACNRLAKEFCEFTGMTFKNYRDLKKSGLAHKFQQDICAGLYNSISWKTIPGKALLNLVGGDFLERHNLTESYINWLDKQPVAKFNGYAYELYLKLQKERKLAEVMTINKQFDNLIKVAKSGNGAIKGNVLCALDTSGSMNYPCFGDLKAYDLCMSLGVYFSELNTGAFHNVVAMFDEDSRLQTLSGTFTEKVDQLTALGRNSAMGGTNFQSLIDLIIDTRTQHPEIPEEEYPSTLLVVSDMQFNPAPRCSFANALFKGQSLVDTNYHIAMEKLSEVFSEEFVKNFKVIWWDCTGRCNDFPSTIDDAGTYVFSGFDPAIVTFLLGGNMPKGSKSPSMEEIVEKALSQEVLQMVLPCNSKRDA